MFDEQGVWDRFKKVLDSIPKHPPTLSYLVEKNCSDQPIEQSRQSTSNFSSSRAQSSAVQLLSHPQ